MLKTFLARAAFASALLTCGAGPAAAENYDILMMENAFFPEVSIVQPGDTITFKNLSNIPRRVKAIDNSWSTGNMQEGESIVFAVTEGMSETFQISTRGTNDPNGGTVGNGEDGTLTEDNATLDSSDTTNPDEPLVVGSLHFAEGETVVGAGN